MLAQLLERRRRPWQAGQACADAVATVDAVARAAAEGHLAVVEKARERDLVIGDVAQRDAELGCRRLWCVE